MIVRPLPGRQQEDERAGGSCAPESVVSEKLDSVAWKGQQGCMIAHHASHHERTLSFDMAWPFVLVVSLGSAHAITTALVL